jgi:hypothetical protein
MAQVIEHLPNNDMILSSNPSTTKKKKKRKKTKKEKNPYFRYNKKVTTNRPWT